MSFTIFVNAESHTLEPTFDPTRSLASFLRSDIGLTGTKIGCHEGGCGACTVLFTSPNSSSPLPMPINACLKLLSSCNNCHILTTEGLGGSNTSFHDIHRAIADGNGSQCGFCTPGWVMACCGFLLSDLPKTPGNMEQFFDGNLCRCTGYRPIIQSFMKLLNNPNGEKEGCTGSCDSCTACDHHNNGSNAASSGGCCGGKGGCGHDIGDLEDLVKKDTTKSGKTLKISNSKHDFYQPTTKDAMLELIKSIDREDLGINAGHTGKGGVEKYYNGTAPYHRGEDAKVIVDVSSVSALQTVTTSGSITTVGSGVTLNKLISNFQKCSYPPFEAAARHVSKVANNQVRNAGTWGGNLMMAQKFPDFPSDVFLTLSALDATISFANYEGEVVANVPVQTFCKGQYFRDNCALLLSFSAEKKEGNWVSRRFKLTQRARNAHAHASLFVTANVAGNKIVAASLAVGGVTVAIEVCPRTAAAMRQAQTDDSSAIKGVLQTFVDELVSLGLNEENDLTKKDYRLLAARNCLMKFYLFLNGDSGGDESVNRPVGGQGVQEFSINVDKLPVTAPVPKVGARLQASGEAKYTHDFASKTDPRSSLHGAFVFAEGVGKAISSINYDNARELGMVEYVDARDQEHDKRIVGDEVLFLGIGDNVPSVGWPVACVLFKNEEDAVKIAAAVEINYEDGDCDALSPVYSLVDAIKYKRIFEPKSASPSIKKGDVSDGLSKSPMRLKGVTTTGGQKHFYFETQSSVTSLGEGGEVEVRSSTQNVSGTQQIIAKVLGIGSSKVVVKQKRAGGGYGGKLTRSFQCAVASALCAVKTGKTCSLVNDRGMDLQLIGGREPMIIEYDVGFDESGKILAVKFLIHCDGGVTIDGAAGSLAMSILWMDHVYNVPDFLCEGILYKTNLSTNTSCRSPGNMQSNFVYEDLIWRIAETLGKSVREVQELNFYKTGDTLPVENSGTSLGDLGEVNLGRCWRELREKAGIEMKERDIAAFNKANRWKKRGMGVMPVKYGISGAGYKQQTRVLIYEDGTVRVGTSGAEIGQGLATKVVQCCALRLGVDLDKIDVHESDTGNNTVNNGATGGSATSEVACQAALNACDVLLQRLKESGGYEVGGDVSFENAVTATSDAGISLSADGSSNPSCSSEFQYFVWVATCAVVELDVLTGETAVLSADIQYDCGEQLNADIDVGQIEGGFVMGLGYFLSEKVVFDQATGYLKSTGTWEYKPPGMLDIPAEFNVRLLQNVGNNAKGNVLRSKAVGEPPMVSSASVWFAVRDAVRNAGGTMDLACPATIDERLLAINKA